MTAELSVQSVVGSYVIERELGRGGMGAVYLGVHQTLGKRAAIKVLLPQMSAREDAIARFWAEARAVTAIQHAGIVDIYDHGVTSDGRAYIVMEHLQGESLGARLKARGLIPIPQAVAIARQVANALAAAHAVGVVHRDLKPDNIFLVPDPDVPAGERAKLLDFGVAKLVAADTTASAKTITGALLGTPHYMSPEQCEGARAVDHRSDLYGLGCTLFQMVSGRLPFESPGVGGLIGMHLHVAPPKLRDRAPHASKTLEAIVARLLEKNPDDRFVSGEALAAALADPDAIDIDAAASAPLPRHHVTADLATAVSRISEQEIQRAQLENAATVVKPPAKRRKLKAGKALAAAALVTIGATTTYVVARGSKPASKPTEPVASTAPVDDPWDRVPPARVPTIHLDGSAAAELVLPKLPELTAEEAELAKPAPMSKKELARANAAREAYDRLVDQLDHNQYIQAKLSLDTIRKNADVTSKVRNDAEELIEDAEDGAKYYFETQAQRLVDKHACGQAVVLAAQFESTFGREVAQGAVKIAKGCTKQSSIEDLFREGRFAEVLTACGQNQPQSSALRMACALSACATKRANEAKTWIRGTDKYDYDVVLNRCRDEHHVVLFDPTQSTNPARQQQPAQSATNPARQQQPAQSATNPLAKPANPPVEKHIEKPNEDDRPEGRPANMPAEQ